MFQQQPQKQSGGRGRHVPPPINTKQAQQGPTPIMRQGRFLSPSHGGDTAGAPPPYHGGSPQHQHVGGGGSGYYNHPSQQQHNHQQYSHYNNPQGSPLVLSPASQSHVHFEEETASADNHSPRFLFEQEEWVESEGSEDDDDYNDEVDNNEAAGNRGNNNDNSASAKPILPTETQLTLLCLDYLRDLRRTYQHKEDLLNAEGLDADYIALAAWSLSRAFLKPRKLTHGSPQLSTVSEIVTKGKRPVDMQYFGCGGMGRLEDEPFGNDAVYRQLDEDDVIIDENDAVCDVKNVISLSENVSLPTMEDITNEILLRHPSDQQNQARPKIDQDDDEDEDNDEPYYEHNDTHYSNAHRFYLLNGLASDASSAAVEGLMTPRGFSPRSASQSGGTNAIIASANFHGSPLTFCEIATAGLQNLRAKSRLDADKEMVNNPLFGQFIQAASAGGFFQEKREDRRRLKSSTPTNNNVNLTPEEGEERRSQLLYEEKYRKVVTKFRTKLATKEAQLLSGQHPETSRSQFGNSPHNFHSSSPSRMGSAYRIMSGNASVSSMGSRAGGGGGGGFGHNVMNVGHVAERQRRRRERRMERVKPQRTYEELMIEEKEETPAGIPMMEAEQQQQQQQGESDHSEEIMISSSRQHDDECQKQTPPGKQTKQPPSNDPFAPSAANLPHYQEAERLSATGNTLMQSKQFQQALDTYTSAIQLAPAGPNSHVYYSNRSAAHLSLNQYEASIKDSECSLALKPDYAKAHSRLGLAYFACGRYGEAVASYESSLEIDPENEWSRDHLVKARERLENDAGEKEKVAKTSTNAEEVAHEDEQKVEQEVEEEDANWPTPFDGDNNNEQEVSAAAEEQEEEEDEQASIPIIDPEIIAQQTQQANNHKNHGNDHMSDKEYEKALQQYNLAISISPSGPNSHVYYSNRAAAYCYLAQYVKATSDCQTSIGLQPTYEKAHARLGLSLFFRGEYESAVEAYEHSLELDPNNKASLSYLKKARKRLDEQQERREREEAEAQQLLQHADGDEESLGDNTGITSTGLTSIVTNDDDTEEGGQQVGISPRSSGGEGEQNFDQSNQQAFDPFATDE